MHLCNAFIYYIPINKLMLINYLLNFDDKNFRYFSIKNIGFFISICKIKESELRINIYALSSKIEYKITALAEK